MTETRPLAVFDIDGVVADVRHRLHHVQSRPKDWAAFFAAADADPPLQAGIDLVREFAAEHDIVWLTGRPEPLREVTTQWLRRHGLTADSVHMRRDGDYRPARQAKLAVLRRLAVKRTIAVVVDDDPEVVATLRAAGLPVYLADWVPYGETLRQGQEREGKT